MASEFEIFRRQVERQLNHWGIAAKTLGDLEITASHAAWAHLERSMGTEIRRSLRRSVVNLMADFAVVRARFGAARSLYDLDSVSDAIVQFRDAYVRTETLVEFFGHAINSRTNPEIGASLPAFDFLAITSMKPVLGALGQPLPPVLTYLDKGLGASILKAGLRLWDGGTFCPVAVIKVTFHNRRRPTALIHETGHQVAHMLGWNRDLATALRAMLANEAPSVAATWASWSSETAADAYGFAHTGFASVAALADVVGGAPAQVFQYLPGDPHPVSYLRVLMGLAMTRRFFGRGPWDEFEQAWRMRYPLESSGNAAAMLKPMENALPRVVEAMLMTKMPAFKGRALTDLVDPMRVAPAALGRLATDGGQSLYASPHWISVEALRLVAATGLRFALEPDKAEAIAAQQDDLMRRLGQAIPAYDMAA